MLRARKAVGLRAPVNVLVTGSSVVRALNRQFRGQNKATDVLSFPAPSPSADSRNRRRVAGEVAISADIALQNSLRLGHPVGQEIKILALHGILHLAGFDHERDNGEMARKENDLAPSAQTAGCLDRASPSPRPGRTCGGERGGWHELRRRHRASSPALDCLRWSLT